VPGREWFIEGLIPSRTVTLLYGDGGLGKSLLALQIGAASALGMQVVGLDPMPGRVLYVAAEDEEAEFHRRLATIVETCGRSLADVGEDLRLVPLADRDAVLMTPDRSGRLAETPLLGQLRKLIFDWRPALVVLDTLADLFGGDEIKRAQVRQFVGSLRAIAIEFDCAILLLAHPSVAGMRDGTGSSGSTAWNNSVRSRLYLTSAEGDTDARVLRTVKANYGPVGGEVKLRWLDGIFVADDGHTGDAAARLVDNVIDKAMLASLRKLQQQGRKVSPNRSPTYAPKVVRTTPECQAFSLPDLEASMHRLLDRELIKVIKDGPPSRQSARLWVP
jgi:RecA-family ATPase